MPIFPPAADPSILALLARVERARVENTVRKLAAFPTRHTLSGAGGADAAAAWLATELRGYGGALRVGIDTWTQPAGRRMDSPATLSNVIATLPGMASPERIVVISGHYDSRVTDVMDAKNTAPGANDDASGVAVVLECARLLAQKPLAATVIFAAVTGEEQGLYGSAHLAKTLADARRNVIAMATNDIVGNSRGQDGRRDDKTVRVFSAGWDPREIASQNARRRSLGVENETPARTLARHLENTARRYRPGLRVELVLRNDRIGRGGDHSAFLDAGLPAAVRVTEPSEDWRHQHQDVRIEKGIRYGDLPEFVDYAYLTKVARLNLAWVAELASAPPAPLRVDVRIDLDPKSTVTWGAVEGAAAYEILWRKTRAAEWQNARAVDASVRSLTLPISKDDHVFGVRAIGKTGARSLPTIAGRG